MNKTALWAIDKVCGRRIRRETRAYLSRLASANGEASRAQSTRLLGELAREPGPHVVLGQTTWTDPVPVRIPLDLLVSAHAIMTGGTGCGKTMAALAIVEAILAAPDSNVSFGVLDAKGELFERCLCLVARELERLPPHRADALRERLVIVDLASPDPVTSYNIASPWAESDLDFFATSRVETLQELLPSGDGLSLRGSSIVKHVIKLLAERGLPFSYFDRVLSSEDLRVRLLAETRDEEVRYYFKFHFPNEGRATVAAVRARMAGALLNSMSLKLALSGSDAPDFRDLQDAGRIVLINCAGPNIPRATARTLQGLFLSDIRQAVFARRTDTPFLWICDEAQHFFRTKHLRENMVELLTMSRSFGSFFVYLTQNLSTAVQDGEMLETLHTNIRWSLSMKGTPKDASFLLPALPMTGRRQKPRTDPFAPAACYSLNEERNLVLSDIAHLADRVGWFWLRSRTGEAMSIRTKTITLPTGAAFKKTVARIRNDIRIGGRIPRAAYLTEIEKRNARWLGEPKADPSELYERTFKAMGDTPV